MLRDDVDLVLRSVRPWGGDPADVHIAGDRIVAVEPSGVGGGVRSVGSIAAAGVTVVDGSGLLALPGLVNAHAHVDKSWWGRPWESYGGEGGTQGRIAHERARRDALGIPGVDVATRVLREGLRTGTTRVRTHVDVDLGVGLRGVHAVQAAAEALDGAVEVSIVAFPQDGVLRRPGVLDLLRQAALAGVAHVGGLDPSLIDRDPVGQLDGLFAIAADTGCGIDLHLHEPADLGAFAIDLVLDRVERDGIAPGKVNIAHGFAVVDVDPVRRRDLLERMAGLGVTMTTVAPLRMRQLPLHEFDEAGVRFGFGTDGIRDLWSPYGDGDLLGIAWQYARAGGMVRDEDLRRVVEIASRDGAAFVTDEVHDLVPGARADVVLVDAENPMDALVRRVPRALVVAGGQVIDPVALEQHPWE
ncbi:cytosine/adenosine deaminase-related metal-dependent hydrolase [Curtobacterium luteum]|uniref:Cytosine/adenosine deaminase-related metal-dependent hydrolase n=1 Tax=Curtobacterium luteum TaxID=33881 RepID=A0ABS2RSE9_9MICO|nr:amidohydrolase family protein [Curtobacterium luteum]MBM7801898.1 cytosine/adenosine deaminase-related metal-dependent hydrolase [Curtobacterium luteum]NUU51787.1 amidohydrolase family protein [Curtobacterium luteum]